MAKPCLAPPAWGGLWGDDNGAVWPLVYPFHQPTVQAGQVGSRDMCPSDQVSCAAAWGNMFSSFIAL